MNRAVLKYILNFVVLVLLQLFVLNNVLVANMLHPYIYIYLIILLPVLYSRVLVLIVGFALGFVIDIYTGSYGMHTIASLSVAFIRPYILSAFQIADSDDPTIEPHFSNLGFNRYLVYVLIIVFIHHFVLFYTEAFTFSHFIHTFLKVAINTISSALIIFVFELLFFFRR